MLNPQGPVGANDLTIMLNALEIMLAIVVPTILVALWFAWWYRESNTRARYQPNWAYSGQIELIVWSIPILVIMFLGGVIWIGSYELDPFRPLPSKEPPLDVQVVALDWKWLFIYPTQGVAGVNELVVPTGVPVHFTITSSSVMNMFFVPQLGSMIAAMPRMASQLNLQADHPGTYHGLSAQYSGAGFSDMNFAVRAVSADEFSAWIEGVKQAGPTLSRALYLRLQEPSSNVRPFTFRSVEPALFDDILRQTIPPGPGPQDGRQSNIHPEHVG